MARRRMALTLLIVFVLSSLGACSLPESPSPRTKIVYGLTLAPSGIDPHVDVSSELGIPLSSVYDTLVFRKDDGSFVPGLAESWEVSQDGLVYTFHLRRGVRFHDGTSFNATAVQRTLARIVDPETKSRKAILLLGPYKGCEVVDPYTVKIMLQEPFAPLLDSLSQVYLAPASPTALYKWGTEYQFHQVGTGPYMMKEYVPKDHLTLVRNPNYDWGPSLHARGGPASVDEIEFRFLVEPAVRLLALEAGDVDVVGEVLPQDGQRVEQSQQLALQPVAIPGLPLVAFLNTRAAPTDDIRVRRALILATDRQSLVEAVFGTYSPVAVGPLSRNHEAYATDLESLYAFDLQGAQALLDEAGWSRDQEGGVRMKDGNPLRLEAYVMSWGLVPQVAQLLQAQWQEVGVELVINEVTFTAALAAVGENKHNLIFWSEPGTDADILRSFFHSENIGMRNWSNVALPALDGLLDEARRETDPQRRLELYREVQRTVMQEALILPIRDYVNLNARRTCIEGLRFDSRGWFPVLHDITVDTACR